MILAQTDAFRIEKKHRLIKVALTIPHRVLSTSSCLGGEQGAQITHILNAQCCEGSPAHAVAADLQKLSREDLHRKICCEARTSFEHTVILTTAANMDYAAVRSESYEDASLTAVVTAGVEGNAGRAGGPSQWHEGPRGFTAVAPGTINIILMFHQPLSPAALTRSLITATEAKTAALLELAVPSRYSPELATGTGTDQIAAACPLREPARFHWTGLHSKLGELIGIAVRSAVREALLWQNGLEISHTRRLSHALGRFGVTRRELAEHLRQVAGEQSDFLLDSLDMVEYDPRVSACAYAMAAILDRRQYGAIPPAHADESLIWQAALLITALSGNPACFAEAQQQLSHLFLSNAQPLNVRQLLAYAISRGWILKWQSSDY